MKKWGEFETTDPLQDSLLLVLKNIEDQHHTEGWENPPVLGIVYRADVTTDMMRDVISDVDGLELPEGIMAGFMFEATRLFDWSDPGFAYHGEHPVKAVHAMAAAIRVSDNKPPGPDKLQCWFIVCESVVTKRSRFRRARPREARILQAVDLTDTVYAVVRYKDTPDEVAADAGTVLDPDLCAGLRELLQASIA